MSDMKLIMENWKRFLNEAEVQEEGWKDIAMAGAMGLSSLAAPAQAADAPIADVPVQVDQAEESQSLGVVSNWGFIGSRIKKIDKEQGTNSSTSWKTDYVFFEIPGTGQVTAYPTDSEVPKNLEPASPTAHDLNYSMLSGYGDYFK